MIRLLPIVLVILALILGLGYLRYQSVKSNLTTPSTIVNQEDQPIEVPKTLPQASLDDRVKSLEDLVTKLVASVNSLKSLKTPTQTTSNDQAAAITELKARVAALEKSSPTSATSNKSPLYIPLGSSTNNWTYIDWTTLNDFQASIDPANYAGYISMQLEVIFRVADPSGTGSVRLYNLTDSSSLGSQLDTTSTTFVLKSSNFTPATGSKTYSIQVKDSTAKEIYIQTARIKVNF